MVGSEVAIIPCVLLERESCVQARSGRFGILYIVGITYVEKVSD